MQSLERRVAYLEGRMQDQSTLLNDLRADLRDFRAEFGTEMRELRAEASRHFVWLVSAQLTILLAIVGALLVPYFRSG